MSTFGPGRKEYFRSGDWNSLCSRCSLRFKFSELIEEWTGHFVCKDCWEPRHPQDFVRGVPETNNVFYTLGEDETDIDGGTYEDPVTTVDDANYTTESDDDTILYNTELTANRAVTLSTSGLIEGQRIQFYRTKADNFKLDVGGLTDLDIPSACYIEWTGNSAQYDLYVDSVNGDDNNDGGHLNSPLATLSKAESKALAFGNGVQIALKFGSEWRDSLDLSSLDSVLIKSYGKKSDGLPVVRGDETVTGTWDTSTDRSDANSNTYSQTLTWDGGGTTFFSMWEDDSRLRPATSLSDCDATPGSFWTDNGVSQGASGDSVVVYVHPNGSTNPNSDNKAYEYSKRAKCVEVGDSCTVRHVWTRRQCHGNGSFLGGENTTVVGGLFEDGVKHESLVEQGTYSYCIAWHPEPDRRTNSIMMEFFSGNDQDGKTCVYDTCIAVGNSKDSTDGQTTTAFGGHWNGTQPALIEYRHCAASTCENAYSGAATKVTSFRCYAENCDWGLRSIGESTEDFTKNCDDDLGGASPTATGLRIYGGARGVRTGSGQLTLSNSVIVNSGNSINAGGASDTASITRTVVEGVNRFLDITKGATEVDNNLYYTTQGTSWRYDGTDYPAAGDPSPSDFTNYKTAIQADLTGAEANSQFAINDSTIDPDFVDPVNGDFTMNNPPANGAGLENPKIDYTPIPSSLSEAEQWILDNVIDDRWRLKRKWFL